MDSMLGRVQVVLVGAEMDRVILEKEHALHHTRQFLERIDEEDHDSKSYLNEATRLLERDLDRLRGGRLKNER
jgi:hypothetical protein